MSTKIYNGYKIEGLTAETLFDWVKEVRPDVTKAAEKVLEDQTTRRAIDALDMHILSACGLLANPAECPKSNCLYAAQSAIRDALYEMKKTNERHPGLDVGAEVVLIPHPTGVYALLYAENNAVSAVFTARSDVKFFGYWNNSDQPDDVSDEEWSFRAQLWDELLGEEGIPSLAGGTFVLARPNMFLPDPAWSNPADRPEFLDPALHSSLADRVTEAIFHTEASAAPDTIDPKSTNFGPLVAHITAIRRGQVPIAEAMRARLTPLLPHPVPTHLLTMPVAELKSHLSQLTLTHELGDAGQVPPSPKM